MAAAREGEGREGVATAAQGWEAAAVPGRADVATVARGLGARGWAVWVKAGQGAQGTVVLVGQVKGVPEVLVTAARVEGVRVRAGPRATWQVAREVRVTVAPETARAAGLGEQGSAAAGWEVGLAAATTGVQGLGAPGLAEGAMVVGWAGAGKAALGWVAAGWVGLATVARGWVESGWAVGRAALD